MPDHERLDPASPGKETGIDPDELSTAVGETTEADADSGASGSTDAEQLSGDKQQKPPREVKLSLRSILVAGLICLLVGATGVLGWLYVSAKSEVDALTQSAAGRERAQQIALDYAVNAAAMDFKDFSGWSARLVKGTTPELTEKLGEAAKSMEQLLAPMQWESTARPLSAIVKSDVDGVYTVDAFVSVLTKTVQAPEGLQSTATYSMTIDSSNDWLITDVGGIDAALGRSGG